MSIRVCVNFGDSRSKRSRDIRAAHFIVNDYTGVRRSSHEAKTPHWPYVLAFCLKTAKRCKYTLNSRANELAIYHQVDRDVMFSEPEMKTSPAIVTGLQI